MIPPKFQKNQTAYLLVGEGAIRCKIKDVYNICRIWFYRIDLKDFYYRFELEYVNEKYLSKTGVYESGNEAISIEELNILLNEHKSCV